MEKPDRSTYTPNDFLSWRETQSIELTPKFQRRGVWKPAARSFFVDTLLRQMPIPPIYLRVVQSAERNRIVRQVVDGQQRVSAVLSFIDGEYRLSRTLSASWAGKTFEALNQEELEFVSEIMIAQLAGMQDKKTSMTSTRSVTRSSVRRTRWPVGFAQSQTRSVRL